MNFNTGNEKVDRLLNKAKKDIKGDYRVYNEYKQQLEDCNLKSDEYTHAILCLANILEV